MTLKTACLITGVLCVATLALGVTTFFTNFSDYGSYYQRRPMGLITYGVSLARDIAMATVFIKMYFLFSAGSADR